MASGDDRRGAKAPGNAVKIWKQFGANLGAIVTKESEEMQIECCCAYRGAKMYGTKNERTKTRCA